MPQPWTPSKLASPPGTCGRGFLVAGRSGSAAGSGRKGSAPFRVGVRRAVVARMPGGGKAAGNAARGHGHAGTLASYGLVRTGEAGAGPALCLDRCLESRRTPRPRAQGASCAGRWQGFPCDQSGSAPITDRLVTPFTRLRAQSGPRRVSPLNFSRGSGSIHRLSWLRGLLTCRSRGRA
jgi:hypothetical protein